jgi:hypothetical protein
MTQELVKRKWVYIAAPSVYEIAPCSCGNHETQWSEYEGHLWCDKCQKDFIPEHGGIFDGPIGLMTCEMLGISFDRFNLETQEIEPFTLDEPENKPDMYLQGYINYMEGGFGR